MVDFLKGAFYLTGSLVMAAFLFVVTSHLKNIEEIKSSEVNFSREDLLNREPTKKEHYILQQAGERIFLMNKQTGAVWRYYFNGVDNQGWELTQFFQCSFNGMNYYKTSPNGEVVSYPSPKN